MPKMCYIMPIRLPTEKAHGLQIVQNCEAFADAGYTVELWVARRWQTADLRAVDDVFEHYGIRENFTIRHLPTLDLMPLDRFSKRLSRPLFFVMLATFLLSVILRALFTRAEVFFSRDASTLFLLSWLKPKHQLAYEAHAYSKSGRGAWLQSQVVRRVGSVIAITPKLREDLIDYGAEPARVIVAHDGIRAERFTDLPSQAEARQELGWSQDAFIVGYVGRLHTMGMDKGVGTLISAVKQVDTVTLALVGGPDETAESHYQAWVQSGETEDRFIKVGQVSPKVIPLYLRAFDVCVMPRPWLEHYAYYTSALKLFEYLASGRALIATDLPAVVHVVTHGETAWIIPPSDVDALAEAIRHLQADDELREQLGKHGYELVMQEYTWATRAERILQLIQSASA